MVINHLSVDPQNIPPFSADSPISRSLSASAEAARILRHVRASQPTPIRVDGAGTPLSTVTAELMIESKRILSSFLGDKMAMIYRVHQKPSRAVKLQFHRALNALKIPNSIENFDNPSEFAGILSSLESRRDPASQALLNDLLDTFLLRTLYGTENHGHYGLRLDSYAEFKPRDASGIANQIQLDALWEEKEPLSEEEVLHRANVLNEKRWRRDERAYKLRFYEMLHDNLSLEGTVCVGTVAAISSKRILVEMPGFSKWALLEGAEADSTLEVGSPVTATLRGFNLQHARFEFILDRQTSPE
jgi:exoribonuclease R